MQKLIAFILFAQLCTPSVFPQTPANWESIETEPTTLTTLQAVAFGEGWFVTAGAGSAYAVSQDGREWFEVPFPDGISDINDVAYANGTFVAVGENGLIITSVDGFEWNKRQSSTSNALLQVGYGNNRWTALGRASTGGQTLVLSSADGASWTLQPNAAFEATGLAFGNGTFVASALAGLTTDLRTSSDLLTWQSTLNFDWGYTLRAVGFSPSLNRFVAVGDYGRVMHSANAANWTAGNSGVDKHLAGVTWANGTFVAVGSQERIISSSDGLAWQTRRAPASSTSHLSDVAFGNGTWVAVGYDHPDFLGEPTPVILVSGGAAVAKLSFASASLTADPANSVVTVEVIRSGNAAGSVSVSYQTVDGTALAGTDYQSTSGTLTWADGDSLPKSISVSVIGTERPAEKNFSISLSAAMGGATLGTPSVVKITLPARIVLGTGWANRYPVMEGERPNGIAFGPAYYVAVGSAGTIGLSENGLVWLDQYSGRTNDLRAVASGNGRYIAVGANGTILSSFDGRLWSPVPWTGTEDLNEILFANNRFVLAGANGLLAWSVDGQTWTRAITSITADLQGLSFGQDIWLATGTEGAVLISRDNALSWQLLPSPTVPGIHLGKSAFGNGTFAVLTSSGFHLTTPDGETWQTRLADASLNIITTPVLKSISFLDGKFVILSAQDRFYTSTNAISWERRESPLTAPSSIALGSGNTLALAENGGVAFSSDSKQWHLSEPQQQFTFRAVAHGSGRYVAVGEQGSVYLSEDGIFWRPLPAFTPHLLRTIIYAGDQFVLGGDNGSIFTSSNGLEWSARSTGTSNKVVQIIHNGTHFLAATTTLGQLTSSILRSADGITWQPTYTPGALTDIEGLAFGNGRYLVFGAANFSETSSDGVNFTSLSAPVSSVDFVAATFGNGLFLRARHRVDLVVGEASLEISPDGRTWERTWSSTTNEISSVAFIDGQFVVLGKDGLFLNSADARTWNAQGLGSSREWHGITGNGSGDWIVVGSRAAIRHRISTPAPAGLDAELKLPLAGASNYTTQPLRLEAAVAEENYVITSVDFYAGENKIGDCLSSPWRLDWVPETPGEYDLFAVVFTTSSRVKQSSSVRVRIKPFPALPEITLHPGSGPVAEGSTLALTIAATGADLQYQWYLNKNKIPGANQPTLTVPGINMGMGGSYYCEVSNPAGSAISLPALITMTPHEGIPAPLWDILEYTPAFNDLNAVTWTGERFVAVGNSGCFAFSENSIDWTGYVLGSLFQDLSAVASGNGLVLAGGEAGTILYSSTGTNWSRVYSGINGPITGLAFGNGKFLAVGTSDTLATSTDGRNWSQAGFNGSIDFHAATFFNGLFYAAGNNGVILSSPDGVDWTPRYTGTSRTFTALASGNGVLLAVGKEGRIFTSNDGVIWTNRTFIELGTFVTAVFANGYFIITDDFGRIYTSPNGTTWEARGSTQTAGIASLTYSPALDRLVYVGRTGEIASSPNAVDWAFTGNGWRNSFRKITRDNGLFLAVGDVGRINFSSDALTWKSGVFKAPDPRVLERMRLYDVAFGANTWVAAGEEGNILASADPEGSWQWYSAGSDHLYAVQYGNARFVAVGVQGIVQVSSNGRDWQPSTVPGGFEAPTLFALEFANGQFVAGGAEGAILSSPDGITWTQRSSGTSSTIRVIRFLNGEFRAVGDAGTSLQSVDGVSWRSSSNVPEADLIDIAFGNGQWWVATSDGRLFTTTFQVGWIERNAGHERGWQNAAGPSSLLVDDNTLYLAGRLGQILRAPLTPVDLPLTGYEAFRATYFTPAERNDDSISGPTADPDKDGVPNLFEYAFGLDPIKADAVGPTFSITSVGPQDSPTLTYQRLKGASDLEFFLESSPDLMTWTVASEWSASVASGPTAATERVTLLSNKALTANQHQFLRLRVRQLPQ